MLQDGQLGGQSFLQVEELVGLAAHRLQRRLHLLTEAHATVKVVRLEHFPRVALAGWRAGLVIEQPQKLRLALAFLGQLGVVHLLQPATHAASSPTENSIAAELLTARSLGGRQPVRPVHAAIVDPLLIAIRIALADDEGHEVHGDHLAALVLAEQELLAAIRQLEVGVLEAASLVGQILRVLHATLFAFSLC